MDKLGFSIRIGVGGKTSRVGDEGTQEGMNLVYGSVPHLSDS